jgi:hypothetical protein
MEHTVDNVQNKFNSFLLCDKRIRERILHCEGKYLYPCWELNPAIQLVA